MYLIGESRREFPKIFVLFVVISLFDLLGIGIIGPFLSVVFVGPDKMPPQIINALSLHDQSHNDLVSLFAIAMVLIYTVKSVFGALIMRVVIAFSQNSKSAFAGN